MLTFGVLVISEQKKSRAKNSVPFAKIAPTSVRDQVSNMFFGLNAVQLNRTQGIFAQY